MSYVSPSINDYFRQVIPVFDTGTPGGDATTSVGLADLYSMVSFDKKTVSTDFLQSYTSEGTITVNSPMAFTAGVSGINLTANNYFSTGSVVVKNVYTSSIFASHVVRTNLVVGNYGIFSNDVLTNYVDGNYGNFSNALYTSTLYTNYGDFDKISTGALYVSSYGIFGSTVTALDFLQPSDRRKKIEVTPLQGAYSTLEELQGVSFLWKDNMRSDVGFIAQDVESVIPGIVTVDGAGDYHMSYQKMIPYLVESVKTLGSRVSTLEGLLSAKA